MSQLRWNVVNRRQREAFRSSNRLLFLFLWQIFSKVGRVLKIVTFTKNSKFLPFPSDRRFFLPAALLCLFFLFEGKKNERGRWSQRQMFLLK